MSSPRILNARVVMFCLLCSAAAMAPAAAQTGASSVVSSASFQPVIAPNSLATVFGQGLSKSITTAQLDSSGKLPTVIDGTSVSVLGTLASLVYVSPTQINFIVPAGTPAGIVTVVVNSPLSNQPISITANVALVSPGLFTIPCLRPDRGAVLNGVTFALEPFQAVTTANPGTDKRTRLSIFGTGFRYSGNTARDPGVVNVASSVQVEATDALGIVRHLQVEYAGPAPNFAGLDQVNAIVPTDLEGVGLVRLRVISGNSSSNTVSIVLSQTLAAGIFANPSFNILTVAGSGNTGYGGDQGNAVRAQMQSPSAVALDSHHNLYIADDASHVVRRVSPDGMITTYAGTGTAGSNGDGGLASEAQLRRPVALAMDASGNLYIADADDHKIRKVSSNGTISTFAGNGTPGFSGDNGPATAAQLSSPSGVAVNSYGTVFIADTGNNRVRKVTGDGLISTFAGTGVAGSAGDGNAAYLAQLSAPDSLAIGADGTVFVADEGNLRIRRIAPDGTIRTVAGGGTVDLSGVSSTQNPASTTVMLQSPIRISIDDDQRLFISDPQNARIRVMNAQCGLALAAGTGVPGFSGDGGPALSAQINRPLGLAPDESGNVFFADANNHRARELFAGNCSSPSVILFEPPTAISGMTVNATVRLSCPVTADTVLQLSVDSSTLQLPVSVTIGAGQTTASFSFVAPPVSSETTFHITASNSQVSASGTIVISPPAGPFGIASLSLLPAVQTGGLPLTGTITLTAPAPPGGTMVALTSDNGAAHVIAAVFVPGGQLSTQFLVVTSPVTQKVIVDITASLNSQNVTASATLLPQGQGTIASLSLSPSTVTGGMQDSMATVTLTAPASSGGVHVVLSSNNSAASVPASITVQEGQTTATFEVSTSPVSTITSVTISATSANTVTANLTVNPGSSGGGQNGNLGGLSISPSSLVGGAPATGTVTLNAPAPQGGLQVSLFSNGSAASVPSSVLVPTGQTFANFQVSTSAVTSLAQITITATAGNSVSASLTVTPASGGGGGGQPGTIISLVITPSSVIGGTPALGTVTLNAAAPASGITVSLSSNSSVASVPPSVIVLAGQTSASFPVATVVVLSSSTATITASAANTVSANLTVNPAAGGQSGNILSLTISPSSVIGGTPAVGTVTLTAPAPSSGVTISLSSNSMNATVQPSVIILSGQTSATFPVATLPVLSSITVTITATGTNSVSANLTLNPVLSGSATLASLTISPSTVIGGTPAVGTVTLTAAAPAGGVTVSLSSNSINATVQPTVVVLAGQTSATFPVVTLAVLASTTATITATASNSLSANLTLNPVTGGGNPTLASLDLSASAVTGGLTTTGTVTLTAAAPPAGVLVSLSSSSMIAAVPPSVLVLSGQTSASFVVTTVPVLMSTPVTISASAGASLTAMLNVTP